MIFGNGFETKIKFKNFRELESNLNRDPGFLKNWNQILDFGKKGTKTRD